MAGGLFSSLFNKQGIYEDLFSRDGSSPPLHRTDLRLGEADDEEDEVEPTPAAAPVRQGKSFFQTHFYGIPIWLICVAFLGFAIQMRKDRK